MIKRIEFLFNLNPSHFTVFLLIMVAENQKKVSESRFGNLYKSILFAILSSKESVIFRECSFLKLFYHLFPALVLYLVCHEVETRHSSIAKCSKVCSSTSKTGNSERKPPVATIVGNKNNNLML
jgi:hypothetical protein